MYILMDGTKVSADEIKAGVESGKAVIVMNHADNHTAFNLMLDGRHFDTRGECFSVWDEAWTKKPRSLRECLLAAYCH